MILRIRALMFLEFFKYLLVILIPLSLNALNCSLSSIDPIPG